MCIGKYKMSSIGIIPIDWDVKRVKDFGQVYTGNTPPTSDLSNYGCEFKFVSPADITDAKYIGHTEKGLSSKGFAASRNAEKGAVLFTCIGSTIGKCAIANESIAFNQQINAVVCDENHDAEFLYYELCRSASIIKLLAGEQAVPIVNKSTFENFKVICPSIYEQKEISKLLSLWDKAIEKQTELIEKLKLRKRGLMQQLLTGKKRIPGFTGEWKQVKLGEVCTFFRNVTLSRGQLNDLDGQIQNVHYGDVLIKYSSILDCVDVSLPYINKDVVINSNADLVQNGDIIMSDTAEDETVGKACEVINVGDRKILAGLHTMLIRPKSGIFAPSFMGYYINSEVYQKQLLPLIQGIKVCSLGKQAVQNTIISVPSRKEQEKIVEILTLCDSEIRSAVKKKAEMQSQKRGLMQQLLTGKKRINFE